MPASDISGPGGRNQLQTKPMTMPGSVMTSGRIWCSRSMAKSTISAQANARRTSSSGVGPKTNQCRTKTTTGQRLDDRIAQRDRGAAVAAAAAQRHVAQRPGCCRATTAGSRSADSATRGDDRLPQRQAMDADVQEAADAQAAQDEHRLRANARRHRHQRGACSWPGSGNSFDSRATVMPPVAGSSTNGVPEGSPGIGGFNPWSLSRVSRPR